MTQPHICVFTWNANSMRLCEVNDEVKAKANRSGILNRRLLSCDIPDFTPQMLSVVNKYKPIIVVISTISEANNFTYYHAEFLPSFMSGLGYNYINRDSLESNGTTRSSIYILQSLAPVTQVFNRALPMLSDTVKIDNSAALGLYVGTTLGTFAFVTANCTENVDNINLAVKKQDVMIRKDGLTSTNVILNSIVRSLGSDKPVDYLIVMGRLGYRISNFSNDGQLVNLSQRLQMPNTDFASHYKLYDEYYRERDVGNVYTLAEGVGNKGITFPPTCDLITNRPQNCNRNCYDNSILPSWCSRILYAVYDPQLHIDCKEYNSITAGKTIAKSSETMIYAVFTCYKS